MRLLDLILYSLIISTRLVTAGSSELQIPGTPLSEAGSDTFQPLKLDLKGFIQIGSDGIARSLDVHGNVIDYHILPSTNTNTTTYDRINPNDSTNDSTNDSSKQTPESTCQSTAGNPQSTLSWYNPRCYGMLCYDTYSCRVAGCYACIQTQNQWRETRCVLRPAWYPPPGTRWRQREWGWGCG